MTGPRPFWEAAYEDPAADAFGPASAEIVELCAALPAGARVLDIGCGDGRNALHLARRGLDVDAFDASPAGVRKLRARAPAGSRLRAWVQDATTFAFPRDYDLIVMHGLLHLLEREARDALLDSARRHTRPGGWHVVAVFTDRLPPPPDLAPHMRGLFREGELRERYADWTGTDWAAYTLEDEHPGGIRHRHPVNRIVARNATPST